MSQLKYEERPFRPCNAGGFLQPAGQGRGRESIRETWGSRGVSCCKTNNWAEPEPLGLGHVLSTQLYVGLGE